LFFYTGTAFNMTIGTDRNRRQSQAVQQLHFANAAMQVGSARTNSIGEIYFVSVLGFLRNMQYIGMNTKIRAVIEHGQRTEDFLENGLSGFAMEVQKIN
jgi:hypothetical protein